MATTTRKRPATRKPAARKKAASRADKWVPPVIMDAHRNAQQMKRRANEIMKRVLRAAGWFVLGFAVCVIVYPHVMG